MAMASLENHLEDFAAPASTNGTFSGQADILMLYRYRHHWLPPFTEINGARLSQRGYSAGKRNYIPLASGLGGGFNSYSFGAWRLAELTGDSGTAIYFPVNQHLALY